ncbi:hypothetical protein [Gordonibacter sp.]|uniref:hypothetical protein n=1 Tax=Gordonibacter sp. TaxID=1968902 RepID=UPI002FC76236
MGWKFRKTLCTLEKLRENEKFAQHLFENKLDLPLATCAMLALSLAGTTCQRAIGQPATD